MRTSIYIKKLRAQMGITQEQLGALLNTRQMTISSWERGRCVPSTPYAYKLIKLCERHNIKVKLEDLLVN